MFDDLTPKSENDSVEPKTEEKPVTESSLGSAGNVPANLSPNPSPGLSPEGGVASVNKNLKQPSNKEFDQRMQKLETKGKKRGIRFSRIGLIVGAIIALVMMGVGYYLLTQVIGITEKTRLSVENIPNIGHNNQREEPNKKENKKTEDITITDEMRACEVDEDCVEVSAGCCPCSSGGLQAAINLSSRDAWTEKITNSCDAVDCLAEDACVDGKVSCENMLCTFSEVKTKKVEVETEKAKGCFDAGETFKLAEKEKKECCDNLQELSPRIDLVEGKCMDFPGEAVCINCGDAECGVGENYCNCPADCEPGMEMNNASSTEETGGLIKEGGVTGDKAVCKGEACGEEAVANIDTDGDGLSDKDELSLGSDINNPDTDGDGLSDGDEVIYGTDVLNPDTDGDGYTDGSEVANGYNPLGEGMLK